MRTGRALVFGLWLVGCSGTSATEVGAPAPAPGSGPGGSGAPAAAPSNDGPSDAGATGHADGSTPAASGGMGDILGTLSGSCGIVKTQLTTTTPSFVENQLVFVAGETYDKASLSPDGDRMYDTANAGGSSTESEVMSLEVLRYCDGAKLLKTETEILYAPPDDSGANSITDYEVSIGGTKIGVSVTRAYKPSSQTLTDSDVKSLLEKKLEGVIRSSQRVLPADKWQKQVLHVWTATTDATQAIERVLPTIDASIRADTIVLVTQTSGGGFIYCNPDPPLGSECP